RMMRKACDKAGLPECASHGLRKCAAVRMAEAGATTAELMAVFGWSSASQAELYTKAAERARLADRAATKLANPAKVRQLRPANPLKGKG
ncbi:MAG: tyrosine-type recombinase/integrase, partial [Pseudomonadota bacterium]